MINKIALVISGETRSYKDLPEGYQMSKIIDMYKTIAKEVDVYGHTWSHCEAPLLKNNFFEIKELQVEDQVVIDNWVKEDFINRSYNNQYSFNDNHTLHIHDPATFVDVHLEASRCAYGQIWSAMRSFCMLKDTFDHYDIIVRLRWDLAINNSNDISRVHINDYLKKCEEIKVHSLNGISRCVAQHDSLLYSGHPFAPMISDISFTFNTEGFKTWCCTKPEDLLIPTFAKADGNQKFEAHTMWSEVWQQLKDAPTIDFGMAVVFNINRTGAWTKAHSEDF